MNNCFNCIKQYNCLKTWKGFNKPNDFNCGEFIKENKYEN